MRIILRSVFLIATLFLFQGIFAQRVTNIKVEPKEAYIEISYDLDANASCNIVLYYSDDKELTWKGPLQKVNGDVGVNQSSGKEKKILWDAASELGSIDGLLQFKIVAKYTSPDQSILQSKLQQHIMDVENRKKDEKLAVLKKKRNFWILPSLLTAGIGGYAYIQTGILYDKYKTATTDAAKMRGQVQTVSTIYPISFAASGVSAIAFIVQNRIYSKEKKKTLSVNPFYVPRGMGINMTVRL